MLKNKVQMNGGLKKIDDNIKYFVSNVYILLL